MNEDTIKQLLVNCVKCLKDGEGNLRLTIGANPSDPTARATSDVLKHVLQENNNDIRTVVKKYGIPVFKDETPDFKPKFSSIPDFNPKRK